MFSNFKDVFITKPHYKGEPPKAVLEASGLGLPDGFYYEYIHNGICRLNNKNGFNIKSGIVKIPNEARKFFSNTDKNITDELLAYAYNAQVELEILPNENNCFIVNGQEINAIDIITIPMKNKTDGNVCFFLKPPPFPEPFKLAVSGGGYSIDILVKRIPNNSVCAQKYESINNETIKFSYTLDLSNKETPFTMDIKIGMPKTVKDVLTAVHIFNAFFEGNGYIEGMKIDFNIREKLNLVPKETIDFWNKLLKLEEYLKVSFDATFEMSINDVNRVEELYRSIIENKPFKTYQTVHDLSGEGGKMAFDDIDDIIGKEIFFEFQEIEELDILGIKINYHKLVGIFGATVKSITFPEDELAGKFEVMLSTTEGKKMYMSTKYFLTENELKSFRNLNEHTVILEKAEELQYN